MNNQIIVVSFVTELGAARTIKIEVGCGGDHSPGLCTSPVAKNSPRARLG